MTFFSLFSRTGPLQRGVLALCVFFSVSAAHAQRMLPPDPQDGQHFRVIALHDIRENVRASFETDPEESALDQRTLAGLFSWLRDDGWTVVSLSQIVAARAGGPRLPPKAMLLSFDDGYRSAYTKAYPLLQAFGYPAVMALVTSWLDVPEGQRVPWGSTTLPRDQFLTWPQAAEMARSGLVEFASHTDALHLGVLANPQGNVLPAAAAHRYDPQTGAYENDAAFGARVEADLRRSRARIEQETGKPVRALAWPYGSYNAQALAAARRAGLEIALTLDDGANDLRQPDALQRISRTLASYEHEAPDYAWLLRQAYGPDYTTPHRAMQVDLDYVYDPDPAQQERNLSRLLDRVRAIGPSSVYLQAYADPDGDGVADAVYFPNRHLPVRADLFSRVAWQLRTRTGVQVYAWMPVMAWRVPANGPRLQTVAAPAGTPAPATARYHRLSPFDPAARAWIGDLYDDLGRHAMFAGVVFHDDATLAEDEDASPAALAAYTGWGLPADMATIQADPALRARWTAGKSRAVTGFTQELAQRLRAWQPQLRTVRNVYARPLLEPASEAWFAQNYALSLAAYDYTAVMAMPAMEKVPAAQADAWLQSLVAVAAATPQGIERTVFELQARDWTTGQAVPDATMARQWEVLRRKGARNLAYYPDDFLNDQPGLATVREAMSLRILPLPPGRPAAVGTGTGAGAGDARAPASPTAAAPGAGAGAAPPATDPAPLERATK